MKKIFIPLVSLFMLVAGCSPEAGQGQSEVEKATESAIERIENATDDLVQKAQNDINDFWKVRRATEDSTLTCTIDSTLANIRVTIEAQIEEAANKIQKESENIENNTQRAFLVGIVGLGLGLIGVLCCLFLFLSRRKEHAIDSEGIKRVVLSVVNERIRSYQPASQMQSGNHVDAYLRDKIQSYVNSDDFEGLLKSMVSTLLQEQLQKRVAEPLPSAQVDVRAHARGYELFARDSKSNMLTIIERSYQRGKSLYRLVLESPDSTKAEVDLCLDQEDAKGRILGKDNLSFEPICSVIRKSDAPTKVCVIAKGVAEKRGENEWEVIKQVKVEFE